MTGYPRTTERLVIRPPKAEDVDVITAYRNDPRVNALQDWDLPYPRERVERLVEKLSKLTDIAPGVGMQLMIELDGTVVGDLYVGLDENSHPPEHGVAEIGFTLIPSAQGRGIAFEAASAVIDDLVERLGVHRVVAQLSPENRASARLLERLGMHVESLAPKSYWCRGAWDDNLVYAMTSQEWREQRGVRRAP